MKIWTNNQFEGHYPVGTAAIVIAESKIKAKKYLDAQLKKEGLPECEAEDFEELKSEDGTIRILCNGEY